MQKPETLYSNFGITIIRQNGKYVMQYDSGEVVSVIRSIEISEREVKELIDLKDGKAIYDYMIKNLGDRV